MNVSGARVRCSGMGSTPVDSDALLRGLYREHHGFLLSYVRRLVGGDTARAEDVVQETLLRAWRHPESFDAGSSVRGWLVTVARRVVIDAERARASRPREVGPVAGDDVAVTEDATEAVLLAAEVADMMASLSAAHQQVVAALYDEDLTVAQAAVALGVPEGTVKSRAYYALRALRAVCEERGIRP